jgi:hypothetical protein
MLLNKDQILQADDVEYRDVPVPEWGGTVRLKAITGADRDQYEMSMARAREKGNLDKANFRAVLLSRSICDEGLRPIFQPRDIYELGKKNARILDKLFDVAAELAGIREADKEEVEENFQFALNGDSTSNSPWHSDGPQSNGDYPELVRES